MNSAVDIYLTKAKQWRNEFEKLRAIALECQLNETLKWGVPCYTSDNRNILLIHGFKEYCAILFFKGALLKDSAGILITQSGNVQAGRQIRFTDVQSIVDSEPVIKGYIAEAVAIEKAGLKIDFKKTAEYQIPEEFQKQLSEMPGLRAAFEALTPGRQRAYILFFAQPKQSKTRESRIEKSIPQILAGKGLNDEYR